MNSKPIPFKAEMVRAILDGCKTQTRRVIKYSDGNRPMLPDDLEDGWPIAYFENRDEYDFLPCPYGQTGDRLWVRETWRDVLWDYGVGYEPGYRATCPMDEVYRWNPSIHMPRWASRITLEITDIRVERVQDISEADAEAEGVDAVSVAEVPRSAAWNRRQDFSRLWDSLNASRPGCSWSDNPWCWVISFERIKP